MESDARRGRGAAAALQLERPQRPEPLLAQAVQQVPQVRQLELKPAEPVQAERQASLPERAVPMLMPEPKPELPSGS